ncbi:MAG TPA: ornithine carbamoyltransferase [Verrucomicrobiae bacterium]|nr:ornithine carbamoyltransferase [Verrucomicrobiae bacterium]
MRHFLKLSDLDAAELKALIKRAQALKRARRRGSRVLAGRTLAMIFAKSSTRTRVSFEVAMDQLGGHALFLSPRDIQLGRGEPLADTARVIGSMCDGIMVRNDSQADQEEIARHSRVPVINGLSELHHPCQLLADVQAFSEARGDIRGATIAWIGDGNNVCHSWIEAARLLDFSLRIACPRGYEPSQEMIKAGGKRIAMLRDPNEAARNADCVVTDVWTSMGQEQENAKRLRVFKGFQVDGVVMRAAAKDAIFMHCLPAHRGEEVSADVIDGPQSVVWAEAENRLHAQKALLEFLLGPRAARAKSAHKPRNNR